jgi:4-amino-4-deoxychorismate lyase
VVVASPLKVPEWKNIQKQFKKYMSLLLESIYLKDGLFRNLHYHEKRMQRAWRELFNKTELIDLTGYLNSLSFPAKGIVKTRVIYDTEVRQVEFVPYQVKPVRSLQLISSDAINYVHKLMNRTDLHQLYDKRGGADDILIVKDGFITDSSYANVAFKKGNEWYTPQHCLLNGTMRQYLLDQGMIKEAMINDKNFVAYESVKLINAMLGWEGEEIALQAIRPYIA